MDEQAQRWQRKIDQAFPHGVVMTADDESGGHTVSFSVPRPEVVDMRGIDPVVFAEIPRHHRNFSGRITAWEQVQEDPLVVKVTMDMDDGKEEVMRWSANVSDANAGSMRDDRTDSLRRSEEGTLFRGGAWSE
jgi:hypothetical protein